MKTLISSGLALLVALAVTGIVGCAKSEAPAENSKATVKYICPMHPEVVQDKPGKCPKCGMALLEKQ